MNIERVRDLREYHGLYQREVAEKIGVSRTFYSLWENQKETIPLKYLNSLSNFYNVSLDYLLGLTDRKELYKDNKKKIKTLNKTDIGKRIKEIRLENKLTLRDLASELNTGHANLCRYENGKNLILTSFAYQLCFKYNISIDWLCGKTENKYLVK